MIDIIEKLLSVAKSLFGLRTTLAKARRERRTQIVTFFTKISDCLAETALALRNGQVPHGRCAELATYAGTLQSVIGDEIGHEQARDLAEELDAAHEVETLMRDLGGLTSGGAEREQQLKRLEEAGGLFRGVATVVEATRD